MWIVVHFKDGRILKGFTHDFTPTEEIFHVTSEQSSGKGTEYEINCSDLKAVFFVRTLEGNKDYTEKRRFEEVGTSTLKGLRIKATFLDGEIIRGIGLGYTKSAKGFFIIPIDSESNNERIYVITNALRDLKTGDEAER